MKWTRHNSVLESVSSEEIFYRKNRNHDGDQPKLNDYVHKAQEFRPWRETEIPIKPVTSKANEPPLKTFEHVTSISSVWVPEKIQLFSSIGRTKVQCSALLIYISW